MIGGDGDDVVLGPGFASTVTYQTFKAFLGAGNDTFTASSANVYNVVSGESGDDTLTGGIGDDTLNGGAGADDLDGGGGINTVTYASSTAGVTVNLATSTASGGEAAGDTIANFRNVTGGSGNDTLTGDDNDNVLDGQGGDDTVDGGGGNDTIRGDISYTGVGADTLRGGDGNDTIFGYAGNDTLIGGDGDDTLSGDTLSAGSGQDILEGGAGNDTMTGGQANDTFVYDGQGADIITDFNGGPGVGDVIRVTGVYTTFTQIQANATLVNGGVDTRIDFGGGNALTLRGFSGVLDTNDFSFDAVEPPPSGPEVTVTGNGVVIADGDGSPDIADHTHFGTVGVGAVATRTFTVENDGNAPLSIAKLKMPKGFKLSEGVSSPIAPGGSDTFTVSIDTKKAGFKSGEITFSTNDPDEAAFNFALSGDVVVLPPEIEVTGNGNVIIDEDLPDLADGTDFGDVTVGSAVIQTFTVSNSGPGTLTISKLKAPKGFKVVEPLASSIASGGSDTFSLQLDTKKIGLKTGQIVFTTNDADEGAFNFALSGNVIAPVAPLRLDGAFGSETAGLFTPDDLMSFIFDKLDISEVFPRNALTDFDLV
ncbi:MAG: choice-of-anchor D domain-containing protein [Pseudorhodoplanes sp.]